MGARILINWQSTEDYSALLSFPMYGFININKLILQIMIIHILLP